MLHKHSSFGTVFVPGGSCTLDICQSTPSSSGGPAIFTSMQLKNSKKHESALQRGDKLSQVGQQLLQGRWCEDLQMPQSMPKFSQT